MKTLDSMHAVNSLDESVDQTLLVIFRAFASIRLAVAILLFFLQGDLREEFSVARGMAIADALLLLIYLSVPILKHQLGRFYLPIGLLWSALMPILIQGFTIYVEIQDIDAEGVLGGRFLDVQTIVSESLIDWALLATVGQILIALMAPLIIIAWRYPLRQVIAFCAVTAIFDIATTIWAMPLHGNQILLLLGLVIARTLLFLVIGGVINRLVNLQKQHHRDLLQANRQLQQYAVTRERLVVSQERNRLARELHDTLAHTLSANAIQLEAISVILDKQPEKARALLSQATTRTREGLDETRRALDALRAAPVENMGLQKAISLLAESTTARYGITVESHFGKGTFSINPEHDHTIYRIVQEAVNNAARHASAKRITIQADYLESNMTFSIVDDGKGFDPTKATGNGHYGLRGIQERAQHINGKLKIDSQVGSGTRITLYVET